MWHAMASSMTKPGMSTAQPNTQTERSLILQVISLETASMHDDGCTT